MLGGVDLIKRIQDGALEEIRTVSTMRIIDRRNVIELDVPGSMGNILQDMGSDSAQIVFTGEMMGKDSKAGIEKLKTKYDTNKPAEFSSNITSIADISNVIIEELYIEQNASNPNRYKYRLVLHEYVEPK
jgi:hypothetical protein